MWCFNQPSFPILIGGEYFLTSMKLQTLSKAWFYGFLPTFLFKKNQNAFFSILTLGVHLHLTMGSKNDWLSFDLSNLEMLTSPTPQFSIPSHSLRCGIMIPTRIGFSRATLPSSALLKLFYFFSIILNQWCSYCHSYFLSASNNLQEQVHSFYDDLVSLDHHFLLIDDPLSYEEAKGHCFKIFFQLTYIIASSWWRYRTINTCLEKSLTKPIALESYHFMPRCKKLPFWDARGWISKVVVEVMLLLAISNLRPICVWNWTAYGMPH